MRAKAPPPTTRSGLAVPTPPAIPNPPTTVCATPPIAENTPDKRLISVGASFETGAAGGIGVSGGVDGSGTLGSGGFGHFSSRMASGSTKAKLVKLGLPV
ncbi:MAG: hypothetical protein LBQ50_03805 [Planctomycetaceae bacterium]|nr:hypothetical protein [Planctomycetaceae bacterium]